MLTRDQAQQMLQETLYAMWVYGAPLSPSLPVPVATSAFVQAVMLECCP